MYKRQLQQAGTAETITDVTPATVDATFARFGIRRIIHGHTHRPAVHEHGDGRERIVVGDWYGDAPIIARASGGQIRLQSLA